MNIYAERLEFYGRLLVKEIIESVAKYGLINEQNFYIWFDAFCNGVVMPEKIREGCVDRNFLIILKKEEYSNLKVDHKGFSVDVMLDSGVVEHFCVTFSSLVRFVDPSEDFSLDFKSVHEPQSMTLSKKDTINYFTDNLLLFPKKHRA